MSQISDEDKSLFAAAVAGTQRLASKQLSVKIHSKTSQKPIKKMAKTTRPGSFYDISTLKNDTDKVTAHQTLLYQQPCVTQQDMKRLKKGLFNKLWEIDLHGMTELEADKALSYFIAEATEHQARYLIIIHGKGYHSDVEYPILKNLVNQRLKQLETVLAFCSAQPKDGGSGAVYVFLKK